MTKVLMRSGVIWACICMMKTRTSGTVSGSGASWAGAGAGEGAATGSSAWTKAEKQKKAAVPAIHPAKAENPEGTRPVERWIFNLTGYLPTKSADG